MADDPYCICYLAEGVSEGVLKPIIEQCRNAGFDLHGNEKSTDVNDNNRKVTLEYDDILEVNITLNLREDQEWNEPEVITRFSMMPLETTVNVSPEQHTRELVQKRVTAILEMTRGIVSVVNPEYVWGFLLVGQKPSKGVQPSEKPISANIERIPWILVLSEPIINDLGGRDHVLKTPAWRVETLSTGHIMIVKTNNPADPTEKPQESPEAHLLQRSPD